MFFSKSKLPITPDDREWIDSDIDWLRKSFGEEHFQAIKTITPTKNFYEMPFDGSIEYAEFVLEQTRVYMAINKEENIILNIIDDEMIDSETGEKLTQKSERFNGMWQDSAGSYQEKEDETIISLSSNQLDDPISLIATIAHELAHVILLGEKRIAENDEFLTDLTAIFYGYGIFLGNSKFKYNTEIHSFGTAYSMSTQGYLPEQIIAYATAKLSLLRNEELTYGKYMTGIFGKHFEKTVKYLKQENSENK